LVAGMLTAQTEKNKPAAVSGDKTALHPTEIQQLQLESTIKDFKIIQLQFTQLITQIKQTNGWGDDVVYDVEHNTFYRQPKTAEKQPEQKTPERK